MMMMTMTTKTMTTIATWNVKKSDTSNSCGNCKHLKVIQKIPEQHDGKARNQGTTEQNHIGYGTHTSESTDVSVQKVSRDK
jgi:hypothetical protein